MEMDGWKDITPHVKEVASQLKEGELLKDEIFSYVEAMQSIEVMNPRMDPYMGSTPLLPEECPVPDSINDEMVVKLLNLHIRHFASFINGTPLAYGLLTSVFAHEPLRCPNEKLRICIQCLLRLVGIIKEVSIWARVNDEDEFCTASYNAVLGVSDDNSTCLSLLAKGVNGLTAGGLRSRMFLIHCLLDLHAKIQEGEFSSLTSLTVCTRNVLSELKNGLDKGESEESPSNSDINETLPGINEELSKSIVGPGPPHDAVLLTLTESLEILSRYIDEIAHLVEVVHCRRLRDLLTFIEMFSSKTPMAASRALLYKIVFWEEGKVFGKYSLKHWVKERISSPSYSSHIHLIEESGILDRFTNIVVEWVRVVGQNRPRMRRRSMRLLSFLGRLQEEVLSHELGRHNGFFPMMGIVMDFSLHCAVTHLSLGCDLSLYINEDFRSVFWYMEFLLNVRAHYRGMAKKCEDDVASSSKSKKKKKKGKSEEDKSSFPLSFNFKYFEGLQHLCRGMFRFIIGLELAGFMTNREFPFGSPNSRYENRFRGLYSLVEPQFIQHEKYLEMSSVGDKTDYKLLLESAATEFREAKAQFSEEHDSILKEARLEKAMMKCHQPLHIVAMVEELRKLVKVCDANLVSGNLFVQMKTVDSGVKRKLQFDSSRHPSYPVIKPGK